MLGSRCIGKEREWIELTTQTRPPRHSFHTEIGRILDAHIDQLAKHLNGWLGWQSEKARHELRALAGSLIYRKNLVAAMNFMRHKSIQITEQFYVRYGSTVIPDVV